MNVKPWAGAVFPPSKWYCGVQTLLQLTGHRNDKTQQPHEYALTESLALEWAYLICTANITSIEQLIVLDKD